jgi:two-component system heavy metal sensor histidine kinase CusS
LSFRTRTVVARATTTLLTLGGSFLGVSLAFRRALDRDLDLALRAESHEEAFEAASLGGRRLALPDSSALTANDVGPLAKYAAIVDQDGHAVTKTSSFACALTSADVASWTPSEPFDLPCNGQTLRAIAVPIPGHAGLSLLLASKRADVEADARVLSQTMFFAFAIAIAWTVAVSRLMSRPIIADHEAISAVVRRVADGDLGARVGTTTRDLEMRRLAADVDEMIARLAGLVDAQQRFVANAAHELRSPLTTLYGELQQALRRERSPEEYKEAIEESLSSARHLVRLADDLLAVARVGAATVGESLELSLHEVIESAKAVVSALARDAEVTLVDEGADVVLHGRPLELSRMVRNLLENAIKHSPRRGTVTIRIARDGDDGATIEVSDQGPGVEDGDSERIFEPFWRSARDRADGGGAGLGLSIAREIARAHGGEVQLVPAEANTGATFRVRLPLRWDGPASRRSGVGAVGVG